MSRESIFSKIRTALEPLAEKTSHPGFDDESITSSSRLQGSLREAFQRNLEAVHGRILNTPDTLASFLRENDCLHGYCDPDLMDPLGHALSAVGLIVETEYDRQRYEDYRFGITQATGAIAESGTIILDDTLTRDRLAALSPWVHIAVFPESSLHRSLSDALTHLGPSHNVIWVTGPSKTADVEGILIEGVHGPGEQIAYLTP
ncbi:L-lactate dehydrogenase complex protein LldG [Haloferula luteola]|uniref:L-lactate dehydrogenase complex protein LldG n=1 Tax=Haloferula luteola TaxID=595692 RepID=A0A840VGZ7_9BACT|nr:LUD domain-containing protein [Haloferula luteola]MBB5353110.1 L-lactate dehydrogenase complex protein LldG [Haloferula luteola]